MSTQVSKTKTNKRNEARKKAEAMKAAKKAARNAKNGGGSVSMPTAKKGKSFVPQAKSAKKK